MVENDPLFKSQLKGAPTDTIYTINKLFIDIDQRYKIKPNMVRQLTQSEKMAAFKTKLSTTIMHEKNNRALVNKTNLQEHELDMVAELGKARIINKEKQKAQKKRVMYCEDSDDERIKGPMIGLGNKSTQKIRKMIEKHFITGL